jgi:hypothetical protein
VLLLCLATAAPAAADFGDPRPITPEGAHAGAGDQATDRAGDTAYIFTLGTDAGASFNLRIRRADGRLGPVREVAPIEHTWSLARVAVDDDGDGVVLWDADESTETDPRFRLYARRFSRSGELGPVVRVAPTSHWVIDARLALQPRGTAVIAWNRFDDEEHYVPHARTLSLGGALGPARRLGPGPDAPAPDVLMDRDGRATLLWTNRHLHARRMAPGGSLSPLHTVRREAFRDERFRIEEAGIDRRGTISAACTWWTRNTAGYPGQDTSRERGCLVRISSRLRMIGTDRRFVPADETFDTVRIGVAPGGRALLGWQRNYYEGAFVRPVRLDGTLGGTRKVAGGGLGQIVLTGDGDGVVTSTGLAADGRHRVIRVTRVRDGAVGRTVTVARAPYDVDYLRGGLTATGRAIITWDAEIQPAQLWTVAGR